MSKLTEIASPVSAKPSVSSTQGLTTLAEQSSMGLTTLVAPLQEAVTEKLFSGGSLASGSVETTPETFADKLVRAAAHRAAEREGRVRLHGRDVQCHSTCTATCTKQYQWINIPVDSEGSLRGECCIWLHGALT